MFYLDDDQVILNKDSIDLIVPKNITDVPMCPIITSWHYKKICPPWGFLHIPSNMQCTAYSGICGVYEYAES
jgi:hypothetical protein